MQGLSFFREPNLYAGDGATQGGVMRTTAGRPGAGEGVGVTSGVTSGITPTPSGSGVGQICASANQCSVKPFFRVAFIVLPKYVFP